jgi:diadenosine tetraphosphate (Ap4A) HIT family hydrolase
MAMGEAGGLTVYEDERFTLAHEAGCAVPGYLIVRVKDGPTSYGELAPEAAQALGALLARAVRAIEAAVGADRVYVLTFAELDRRLHVHLFPRAPWLLEAYRRTGGGREGPVNGPAMFEWARATFAAGAAPPPGAGSVAAACAALRERLRGR